MIYNTIIYSNKTSTKKIVFSQKAIKGQEIFQNNNCISCHQIYGLGGYLGTDITNLYKSKIKNKEYISAILNSGIKSMPKFYFNKNEIDQLMVFFDEISQTGIYPLIDTNINNYGWVQIKE